MNPLKYDMSSENMYYRMMGNTGIQVSILSYGFWATYGVKNRLQDSEGVEMAKECMKIARNAGVKAASGKYIAFLDSDDCWVNNKLEYQVKLMEENGWNISHTSYYRTNTLLDNTKIIRSGRFSFIFPFLAFHCPIATPTVMVNKNLLSLHSFKPELRYGEDVLLWLEISKKYKVYGINIPLSIVNTGENTASNNNEIQKDVFKMLTNNGFNGHPFLSFFHFIYRKFRTIF